MTKFLKKSDCDLPLAEKLPGKKHRFNPSGSSEFETKREWVENEATKWYEHMRKHPKFDDTAFFRKADCLKSHLRKSNVAVSEARQLIVKNEERNVAQSESEEDDDDVGNDSDSDTEVMDTEDNYNELSDAMDVEEVTGSQDLFANSGEENDREKTRIEIETRIDKVLAKPIEEVLANEKSLPKSVLASRKFKAKKEEYIKPSCKG